MGEISGTHRGDIGEIQGPFRVRAKLRVRVRVRVRVTVRVRVRVRVMVTVGVRVMVTVGVRVRARARVRVRVRVRGRVPGVRRAVRTARACPRPPACRMRTCERVRAQTLSLGAASGLGGLAGGFDGRGSALAHGCGRSGRVVLPLPRAAAVSTRLRVQELRLAEGALALLALADERLVRGILRVRLGLGLGLG